MKNRNVIIHTHIFKNAGTTFDWILKKNFGNRCVILEFLDHEKLWDMKYVIKYLEKNQDIDAISSHQFAIDIQKSNFFQPHFSIFIRDPIDRIFSVYEHFRRWDEDYELYSLAKEESFKEFVTNMYAENSHFKENPTIKNAQCCYLNGSQFIKEFTNSDFTKATECLKKNSVLGVVERFDESLVLAEEILRNYFPNIDFSYIKQNVNQNRKENLEARLTEIKDLLGKEIMKEVIKKNEWDIKIYQVANFELDSRIRNISQFEKKLENFKSRCDKIQNKS